jgi:hypothetical protein
MIDVGWFGVGFVGIWGRKNIQNTANIFMSFIHVLQS